MINIFRCLLHFVIVVILTVITQIGGVAYLLSLVFKKYIARVGKLKFGYGFLLFAIFYGLLWGGSIFIAPQFGRVALPCFSDQTDKIAVQSPLYCLLNRHYVTPKLLELGNALASSIDARFPRTQTQALDANFPFFDKFPLLPHLSHDDGRKLDIAFYYRNDKNEYVVGKTKSPIGYWGFEQPTDSRSQLCSNNDDNWNLRWDMDWFQFLNKQHYQLDRERTSVALQWLANQGQSYKVSKIFVEPYLAKRLGVSNKIIRFQGCRAARHDDHIHIQIAK
ncbi:hypothetical protein WH96_00265 [Kiloniella spongiae]|uniref:Uncharacterized protein n=1 Tax=Kiloniella spongiae TaxID=1489064 RepID=A0A0H2MIN0_9PROT|nr:hypothetical protein [Kiloniella spongiae]KLN62021.1 hypothetical protein WH96_00265 [Kiloniella spongiae]